MLGVVKGGAWIVVDAGTDASAADVADAADDDDWGTAACGSNDAGITGDGDEAARVAPATANARAAVSASGNLLNLTAADFDHAARVDGVASAAGTDARAIAAPGSP